MKGIKINHIVVHNHLPHLFDKSLRIIIIKINQGITNKIRPNITHKIQIGGFHAAFTKEYI
jgi:abortive infection bacteriophage resistance protein